MKMDEIRTLAKSYGINSFGRTKIELVREIQLRQGHFDCFAKVIDYCDQLNCCFRDACFVEGQKTRDP